jgi:CHAT domain-containing protein
MASPPNGFATLTRRSVALALCLAAAPLQAQTAADTAHTQQALGRIAEEDSFGALSAEGAVLYGQEAVKLDGYQYCSQAIDDAEHGEFRLSVRAASKALHLAQEGHNEDLLALALRDLAIAYGYSGNYELSERYARETLKHTPNSPQQVYGPAEKTLGDAQLHQGHTDEAVASYRAALQLSSPRFQPLVRNALVNALIEAGDLATAEREFSAMPPLTDTALQQEALRTQARLLLARGRPEEALAIYDKLAQHPPANDPEYTRFWAYDGIAQSDLALGRKSEAAAAYDEAIVHIDAVRARFHSEEIKMGLFSNVQSVFEHAIALHLDLNDDAGAFDISEKGRARALLDAVRGRNGRDLPGAATLGLKQVQARLRPDEEVVEFQTLADRTVVWVVDADAEHSATLPLKRGDLTQLVNAFRDSIINGRRSAVGGAEQIGALLLGPLDLKHDRRLIIVPHGPLHYLPFQALRLNSRYLIEDHPISVAPSISIAMGLAAKSPAAPAKLLAFGNPQIEPRFDLPGSEREVHNIAVNFTDPTVYLRNQATKSRFLEQSGSLPIVHVAAHAQADTVDPLYSRILLASDTGQKDFLEAHEVLDLHLEHASLITLSACESGLGRIADGDEALGFTRSFLAAGTSSLIASLWPVSDDSANLLMSTLYARLRAGDDLQLAMRQAQLAVLGNPKMQHPFFWAPFNLIGNWRLTLAGATAP